MKKIVEIFSIVLIFITVLCTVTTTFVYAQPAIPTANEYEPQEEDVPTKFTNMIGTIATIIQAIGIVLSVIVIVMLGIKYMTGSVAERADYKKAMLPFLVGAVLIAATGTIAKIISGLTSQSL